MNGWKAGGDRTDPRDPERSLDDPPGVGDGIAGDGGNASKRGATGERLAGPDGDPHVLLLVAHEENRRLLSEWLSRSYDVSTPGLDESLPEAFDLAVFDRRGYAAFATALEAHEPRSTGGFVPYLLVSPRETGELSPAIWERVDEVISTPVQRRELQTRIEGLLERRTLFVALEARQRTIEALHDATREMVAAATPERICEIAVDAAERALGLPMTAVWLLDEDETALEPVAQAEASRAVFDSLPSFAEGSETLAWRALESGETLAFDDLSTVDGDALHDADTPIRSEVVLPLGERGVMITGSTSPRTFDRDDLRGLELLAANAATALGRAFRERRLAEETSRMEFFNSILRHDVLNGMTVIRSRADALEASVDDAEQRKYARAILDWSDDVVDVVNRVRTVLDTLTGQSRTECQPVDLAGVVSEEISTLRRAYPEVSFDCDVPAGVTVDADELLSEVLGNVLANAIEHNDTDGLEVSVTATASDGVVTLRVADTGGGIPDEDKEAIFRRGETGHVKSTGSGFGLFFVDSMIEEYGGSIDVEDNEPTGAVFVVELPGAVDP